MIKKAIVILVLILFASTNISAMIGVIQDNNIRILSNPNPEDEEDQHQKIDDYYLFNISDIQILAQSFKPTKKYLTRVELKIHQGIYPSNTDLIFSIKEEVDGRDLTHLKIRYEEINSSDNNSSYWFNFDFPDISLNVDNEYFIVVRIAYNDLYYGYAWDTCLNSDIIDHYPNGSMWINNLNEDFGWIESIHDACFITYGYNDNYSFPDLECEGSLLWEEKNPGEILSGNFEIKNIGDYNSKLDWEIYEYPIWGEWSFNPIEGYNLNGNETVNVKVTVVAPTDKESYFSGFIKIVNKNNDNDCDVIPVTITTSKIKNQKLNFILEIIKIFIFKKSK